MSELEKEREFREEAERLAQLSKEDQQKIISMHRTDASNPRVPKADRKYAKERADVLEKFLGLSRRKR